MQIRWFSSGDTLRDAKIVATTTDGCTVAIDVARTARKRSGGSDCRFTGRCNSTKARHFHGDRKTVVPMPAYLLFVACNAIPFYTDTELRFRAVLLNVQLKVMFKHIQPIAITVAFFFAYVLPTVALFVLGGIGIAERETGTYSATWLSMLLVASYVGCPVAGGYLVARLGKQKSYTHALIVSFIAGISIGLMTEPFSVRSTLMWIAIFSTSGIVGAWIYERFTAKRRTSAF